MNQTTTPPTPPTNPGPSLHPNQPREPKNSNLVKLLLAGLALILALVLALALTHHKKTTNNPSQPPAAVVPTAQVNITKEGFVPQTLSVKSGTKVIWADTDSTSTHIVASDPYPKDDSLASLKSSQLGQGTSYSYSFNQKGTINYHDDLNPTITGTIVVE